MSQTPLTQGVHHVGLTVPDIAETKRFFVDVLGFDEVGGRPSYPSVFLSDGVTMLTLWQAVAPESAVAFDRKNNVGLHHVAFTLGDHAALEQLHQRLVADQGVVLEFAPEPLGATPLKHMMCSIPGGIRVEFIAAS